jgi:NADH-quinone oxidoreductase subunit C
MSRLDEVEARVRGRLPEAVRDAWTAVGEDVLLVEPGSIKEVLRGLRDDTESPFSILADVSAVDWLPREPRFDVNYHLLSLQAGAQRLRVKAQLAGDNPEIDSCFDVWPTADWLEREVYDLMGIRFTGHPNLRRILMPEEWIGHPHRKDYPVGGVPVEYKIEPAYAGGAVSSAGLPSMGGIPARLRRDRGRRSPWTWSGPPATEVAPPARHGPEQGGAE